VQARPLALDEEGVVLWVENGLLDLVDRRRP